MKKKITIKKSNCKSYETAFTPSFKAGIGDITAKGIGHLLDTKILQKGAKKFSAYDTDIARNMTIATDMILTGTFAYQMIKSNERYARSRTLKHMICKIEQFSEK